MSEYRVELEYSDNVVDVVAIGPHAAAGVVLDALLGEHIDTPVRIFLHKVVVKNG